MQEYINEYLRICKSISSIYFWEGSKAIIEPLRGAHPFVEIITRMLEEKEVPFNKYPVITSGFITNRKNIITMGLTDAISEQEPEGLSFLIPDTFLSGSSIRGFKKLFHHEIIHDIINELGLRNTEIGLTYAIIKQNHPNEFYQSSYVRNKIENQITLNIKSYIIGTGIIISEDNPQLLGVDYLNTTLNNNGQKLPIITEKKSELINEAINQLS